MTVSESLEGLNTTLRTEGYTLPPLGTVREPVQLGGRAAWLYDLARIWAMRSREQIVLVGANDHIHTRNSAHYAGRAVDIQGTGLNELAAWYRGFGLLVYWQVAGHWRHVHVEVGSECQQETGVCLTRGCKAYCSRS